MTSETFDDLPDWTEVSNGVFKVTVTHRLGLRGEWSGLDFDDLLDGAKKCAHAVTQRRL